MKVYAVQEFVKDCWKTIYFATYEDDAELSLTFAKELTNRPLRLVSFGVDSFDFIAVHARDFAVLQKINY